ncbi:MAG TPA: RdgB/HAM1 family non-canonical purine NTP pyrophosphatase, partial [Terriglobales bacterium]|nr:RdgB/HAM1 family non-canonical purine NTP pyrophosphatase [Terriglobales bacterium]
RAPAVGVMVRFQPMRLLLATNNPGKVQELKALLADNPSLDILTPEKVGVELSVEETGSTYQENAELKAVACAKASQLPCLADDSGLEVDALNGAPGLYSNRYFPGAHTDAERRAALRAALADFPKPWTAKFRSYVCLALPDGKRFVAEGECGGEVIAGERGEGGFGYDQIFLIAGLGKTMAELSLSEKNQLSHRARAIEKIKASIKE